VSEILAQLARTLTESRLHALALYILSEVPGSPPVIQTVHLLGIATVMGSIVMIDLRVLGLMLPSQSPGELTRRLMPWMWVALPFMAISGLAFVLARPARYLSNPVFGLKFSMLVPALVLAAVFHAAIARDERYWDRSRGRRVAARIVAACSLVLWIGVAMMGRWIAYADYLFPE
jgi:hypothetical protein